MGRKVRLLYVLAAAFVIAATGLLVMNRLDGEIAVEEDIARETRLYQLSVNAENSDYTKEVAMQDTSTYIMGLAQEYGYLSPGQIRFVVVNPEVLYDPVAEEPAEETEASETEAAE